MASLRHAPIDPSSPLALSCVHSQCSAAAAAAARPPWSPSRTSSSLSSSLLSGAAAYSEYSCNDTTGNFTAGSAFAANLDRLAAALPSNASSSASLFASAAVGASPDTAYGLALCRGDVADPRACSACLADAISLLRRLCGADGDATLYADLCTARYSRADFPARRQLPRDQRAGRERDASTYYGWDARNATSRTLFLSLVGTLFGEMAMYAAYNSSAASLFATAAMYVNPQLPTVYGLVQCTPDLSRAECWGCLQGLQDLKWRWYDGREGGRILGIRCSFRYEAYHFFAGMPEVRIGLPPDDAPSSSPAAGGQGSSNHRKVLAIALIVSITAFCAMIAAGFVTIRTQRKRAEKRKLQLQAQAQSRNSSTTEDALKLWRIEESSSDFTLYDFPELAAATGGFSDENLLGRGGFGPVYKGKLRDGAEIAVKRPAAHSGQGLEEFKNEIQLIAKLQHTNLVRLVSCCVQEEEKLLVYEYMPNRSLNCFIFDQKLGQVLGWEQRRRIVEGVAQGLLYLHKHSRVRIIHRDLKASNILLDKDLNPKISDFGMARIFGTNMTEANTKQGRRHLWIHGAGVRFRGHLLGEVRRVQLRRVAAGDRQRQEEQRPASPLRRLRQPPRIQNESDQGSVDQAIEVGFDICGTDPEPDFDNTQGEASEQMCFGPCCMTVFSVKEEEE